MRHGAKLLPRKRPIISAAAGPRVHAPSQPDSAETKLTASGARDYALQLMEPDIIHLSH